MPVEDSLTSRVKSVLKKYLQLLEHNECIRHHSYGRTTYDSKTVLALRASRGKNRNRNLIDWRYWNKSLFWRKFINLVWLMAVLAVDVAAVRERHCAAAIVSDDVSAACVKAGGTRFEQFQTPTLC